MAKSNLLLLAVVVTAMSLSAAGSAAAQSPARPSAALPPQYTLASLGAYLFYNDTGTFSRNIPENAPLWNTIVGEGWAGKASNATLVRVTVTGAPGSFAPGRAVQVIVRKGVQTQSGSFQWGRVVLNRRQSLPVLNKRGRTTLGFWIDNTGCTPLKVTAILRGQTSQRQLQRVIPFACGE